MNNRKIFFGILTVAILSASACTADNDSSLYEDSIERKLITIKQEQKAIERKLITIKQEAIERKLITVKQKPKN